MYKWVVMCAVLLAPTVTWSQDGAAPSAVPSPVVADPAVPAAVPVVAPVAQPVVTPKAAPATSTAKPVKAQSPTKKAEGGLMTMMNDGGPMMWIIFVVSLLGLLIFLERGNTLYWQMRLDFKGFMLSFRKDTESKNYQGAKATTSGAKSKHPVVKVANQALAKAASERSRREVETIMEDQMLAALPSLNKRIGLLSFLANSSTLLGLLGTIFGLIAAFAAFGDPNIPAALKQAKLTDGISQAMYTTAAGIVAAVPLLFFHHLLSERQEEIMNEMEAGATRLMATFESNDLFHEDAPEV
jgi:biopolymer transport protein ExbB